MECCCDLWVRTCGSDTKRQLTDVIFAAVYYEILYRPLCGFDFSKDAPSVVEIGTGSNPVSGICLPDIGR